MFLSCLRIPPLLASALLIGCTTLADTAPGTALSEVERRFGSPTLSCPLADAGQRVIWSQQPSGQYAWAAQLDTEGRIVAPIEALLTDTSFQRLHAGMLREALRCTFGPPALIGQAGLGAQRQEVWSYRYRENGVWNSLMHVYLDPEGRVTRFHPGPDPMYDEDRWLSNLL